MAESLRNIRERLRQALSRDFPDQDTAGSPVYNLRELFARVVQSVQERQDDENRARSPRTAIGQDLDEWGRFLGSQRAEATRAQAQAAVESSKTGRVLQEVAARRFLPEGQILETPSGRPVELAEELEIPLTSRQASVAVRSLATGPVSEIAAGSALSLPRASSLSGYLTITLEEALGGGQARESDEQFRFRLSKSLRDPSTIEGLIGILLGDPAVRDVSLAEGVYGIGTAEARVDPAVPYPTGEDRDRIESLAQDGPANVLVLFPSYEGLSLRVRVLEDPSDEELSRLEPTIQQVTADFVNSGEAGARLSMERLERRLFDATRRGVQVVAARRGRVSEDGSQLLSPTDLGDVSGLTPRNTDTMFYSREGWTAVCA